MNNCFAFANQTVYACLGAVRHLCLRFYQEIIFILVDWVSKVIKEPPDKAPLSAARLLTFFGTPAFNWNQQIFADSRSGWAQRGGGSIIGLCDWTSHFILVCHAALCFPPVALTHESRSFLPALQPITSLPALLLPDVPIITISAVAINLCSSLGLRALLFSTVNSGGSGAKP